MGFGNTLGATTLGHPLNFGVVLRLEPDERIEASCVKADVSIGDHPLSSLSVQVRIEGRPGSTERRLRVTTTVPIEEPVVAIALNVGCPARLSRNYVVFADPPSATTTAPASALPDISDQPDASSSPLASVISPQGEPPVRSTLPRVAPGASAQRPRAASNPAPGASAPRPAVATGAARKATRSPKPAAESARPKGPTLQLDPVETDALISPSLRMSSQLTPLAEAARAAGSAPYRFIDPELVDRLQAQDRLKALEASMNQLRTEGQVRQQSIADLQAKVQQAQSARYANPLVYALALLCALLAAGLGFLVWQRWRERQAAAWWVEPPAPAPAAALAGTPADPPRTIPAAMSPEPFAGGAVLVDTPPPVRKRSAAPRPPSPMASDVTLTPRAVAAMQATLSRATEPGTDLDPDSLEPHRPMSADELIDLDQQVEFFVVLGQDDAAVDLLMGHVRSTGGVSPLPYLKLMEIYRRRGERDPYDRIRERFNRRFNAYAVEWDENDPTKERDLEEGFPDVLARVQSLWSAPAEAMAALDGALFRRNQGPPFDVPAYRDLLFLYGIARDLAERDVRPEGVDLLLPIDSLAITLDLPATGDSSGPRPDAALLPPPGTPAPPAPQVERLSLDLDISTDPARLAGAAAAPNDAGVSHPGLDFDLSELSALDAPRQPKTRGSR
jgi:hypothetical protein